jgi:hypothetical protein
MLQFKFSVNNDDYVKNGNKFLYGENDKFMTTGHFLEAFLRRYYGVDNWYKADNVAFNIDSDINVNDKHISVKSHNFSYTETKGFVTTEKTESKRIELINNFFKNSHSNTYTFVDFKINEKDTVLTCYEFTKQEFYKIALKFAVLDKISSKKKNIPTYKLKCRVVINTMLQAL